MTSEKNGIIKCYARRRVNPFLGVLQIIETDDGRASSADGLSWEIEVSKFVDMDQVTGSPGIEKHYYRHGLWSEEQGLIDRELSLVDTNDEFISRGKRVIQTLKHQLKHLPFKVTDQFEYWLLDKEDEQPLVLLATALNENEFPDPLPRYWSGCQGFNGVDSQHRFPQTDELEFLIKECAGFNRCYQWFIRNEDGSATALESDRQYGRDYFPSYLIQQSWPLPEHRQLVEDYIQWIAPSLLTLSSLSDNERNRLEAALPTQAVSIEHHWRLYPQIIDQKKINRARVQRQLQHASVSGS